MPRRAPCRRPVGFAALLMIALLPTLLPTLLPAQISYVEVGAASGLVETYVSMPTGFGGGAAAADYDDDGFVDVFLPTTKDVPHLLYRNLGNGLFEDVAASVGLDGRWAARAALWLDYDGDHRLDLLVAIDCYETDCQGIGSFLRLFRQQEGGTFVETTAAAGLGETGSTNLMHRSGLAAGDLDGDGDPDLLTGYWRGYLKLFQNQGDGTFVDITAASGLDLSVLSYHQPVIQDLDGDGRLDIYAAVDFTENRLWSNQGNVGGVPTFVDVAPTASCANAMNDMGVAVGDYDGDRNPDLYVTNIFRDDKHNILLRNQSTPGSPGWSELSDAAGVRDGGWGWGATFGDLDNDGDLDLAETNGWVSSLWHHPLRIFEHQGNSPPTFVDVAATAGFADLSWGTTLLAFDFDRDGDLDLWETVSDVVEKGSTPDAVRLYRNELTAGAPDRHFLVIRPRMESGPNARALGARVEAEVGGSSLVRWIGAGTSYLGQEPAEAFFGLGSTERVDRLTVHWPDGRQTIRTAVDADQALTVSDAGLFADGFETGTGGMWSAVSPPTRRARAVAADAARE